MGPPYKILRLWGGHQFQSNVNCYCVLEEIFELKQMVLKPTADVYYDSSECGLCSSRISRVDSRLAVDGSLTRGQAFYQHWKVPPLFGPMLLFLQTVSF